MRAKITKLFLNLKLFLHISHITPKWLIFLGTTIKHTWTKPRGEGLRGERWGCVGWGRVVGRKGRQLYLDYNKKIKELRQNGKKN